MAPSVGQFKLYWALGNLQQQQLVINLMDKLKEAASFLKNKFQPDELDEKLNEAVSQQNWQASTKLLHEIANASFNFENQQRIIVFVWGKLQNKSWKKVLKTLHLIDFLIKYGPTSIVDNFKENVYEFRKLDDYSHKSGSTDQGESIRKQAKVIVGLLTDDQLLNDERAKAKQIKDRMANVIGSGAYFGGFSSDIKTTVTGQIGAKGTSYGNISSETYQHTSSNYGKGMSFGESVMKELQQKKRSTHQVEIERPSPTPPASNKLNLSNMLEKKAEKKPEAQKKSFNSLATKLTKPPEKKTPVGPGSKPSPAVKAPAKTMPATKAGGAVDIMDFDFNAMTISEPAVSSSSDPMDLLGGLSSSPQAAETTNNNNFGLLGQPTAHSRPQQSYHTEPQSFGGFSFDSIQQGPQASKKAPPTQINYQQQQYSPPPQQTFNMFGGQSSNNNANNFNFGQSRPQNQSACLSIHLQQEKPEGKKDEGSLIDFSNFREQLGNVKHEAPKESITANWNW